MTRNEMYVTREILSLYPEMCEALRRRAEELESLSGPDGSGAVQCRAALPEQQRVIERKLRDSGYCLLLAVVERISGKLDEAAGEMREVIGRLFFRGEPAEHVAAAMFFSVRSVWYKRARALEYMRNTCVPLYPVVARWKADRDEDRIEAMRSLPPPVPGGQARE
jgi:hypothetical protein